MNPYLKLAKEAVEKYIKENKIISPSPSLPKEMLEKKAGVFVTIEKQGELRGCIGTYLPTKNNIAEEIIANAISSATRDPRFYPVSKEELNDLKYTVYILGEPEPVKNINELDPKKYGVIVVSKDKKDGISKTGLLLPDLEGVDSPEKQIAIACAKAGLNPNTEKFLIFKFSAKKYNE